MAAPQTANMPDNVDIGASFTLQIAALDPTTGAAVSGVKFSNMAIEADNLGGGDLTSGPFLPFMLVPGPGA
jgi:hypothetical protein